MNLSFGLSRAIPPGVSCAWGARFIFPDDLVFNRQDLVGEGDAKKALIEWLNPGPNGGAIGKAQANARAAADQYLISRPGSEQVVLYADDRGVIVACPNSSHGYLYVAGWLHQGEADKQPAPEFKALELKPARKGRRA